MPDPKDCRQRALECVWLSRSSPQERETYLNLARIWLRLAKDLRYDLENSERLLDERGEYKKAS